MTFKLARFIPHTQKPPGTMGECIPSGGIGRPGRKFGNAFGRLCSYFACLVSLSVHCQTAFPFFPNWREWFENGISLVAMVVSNSFAFPGLAWHLHADLPQHRHQQHGRASLVVRELLYAHHEQQPILCLTCRAESQGFSMGLGRFHGFPPETNCLSIT